MARRHLRQRLQDMLDAIDRATAYAASIRLEDYRRDPLRRDAVERCIEIVSEASRHIPPELLLAEPQIPWRDIRNIGNVLRHAYDGVDAEAVWLTVGRDLPLLKAAILRLREALPPADN